MQLRQQLINDGNQTFDAFLNPEDGNEESENDNGVPDFGQPDDDMPEYMDADAPCHNEMVWPTVFC